MPSKIILLSGPISSGKSTLGDLLVEKYGAVRFKTNQLIHTLRPNVAGERRALQEAGESLDRRTKGLWVRDALVREIEGLSDDQIVIVDAVRIIPQIHGIRRAFGPKVVHVHLTASQPELDRRYKKRETMIRELGSYAEVKNSETEGAIDDLAEIADAVILTDRCTANDVLVRTASRLNLYPRAVVPLVDVLVGGQYGSEGKGHIASYMARDYKNLIRVGGPNAGHKVFRDDGPYTFRLLPSGTFASDAKLIIGPGANIAVDVLRKEIADWDVSGSRLSIDPLAMIIENQDRRYEKRRLEKEIGSTAQGVGAATARRINHRGRVKLAKDIEELKPFVRDTGELLERSFAQNERSLLEGTQGTSLSLYHGDYPWVTSRDTTVSGCIAEAGISPNRVRKILMVCRTYPIRVGGTSGPMSQEISRAEIARRSGLSYAEILKVERTSTTDRPRRIAEFDWAQLKNSSILNGPTDLALTFTDYLSKENRKARRFEQLTDETIRFIGEVERVSGAPVSLISTRFSYRSIIDRRAW